MSQVFISKVEIDTMLHLVQSEDVQKVQPKGFTPLSKWDVLQYLGLCECSVFITGTLNWGHKVKHSNSLMSCDMDKVLARDFGEWPAAQSAGLPQSLPVVFKRSLIWLFIYQIKVIKPSSNTKDLKSLRFREIISTKVWKDLI